MNHFDPLDPRCPKCDRRLVPRSKSDYWCSMCWERWWTHAGTLIDRETLKRISSDGT